MIIVILVIFQGFVAFLFQFQGVKTYDRGWG